MTDVHEPSRTQQVCEALITKLDAADHAGVAFSDIVSATRTYSTLQDLSDIGDTLVAVVAPQFTKRIRDSNGTYLRFVVVDIFMRIHLTSDVDEDLATMDQRVYLMEEIDDYLADPDNHDLTLPDGAIAEYVEPTDTRADADVLEGLGVMWDSDMLDTDRQVTGLVRVAYRIDEDY